MRFFSILAVAMALSLAGCGGSDKPKDAKDGVKVKDAVKDTVKDVVKDTVKDVAKDVVKDSVKDVVKDATTKDAPK